MNATPTSFDSVSPAEPSDSYAATPEVVPEPASPPPSRMEPEESRKKTETDCRIDTEAYNDLKKADPHWETTFCHTEVRGERWAADFLKLDKENYFKMLGEIHRGEKNGPKYEHSELRTHQLRSYLVENIGLRLNMTEYQITRAKARATNVDAERFGKKLELVVFCACAYVVHRDSSTAFADSRKYHPNSPVVDEIFEQVASDFELTEREIKRVCRQFDQLFTDQLPPCGFSDRKPGWTPKMSSNREIVQARPEVTMGKGTRWRGGI